MAKFDKNGFIYELEENEARDIPSYEGIYACTKDGKIWSYPKMHGMSPRKGFWLKQNTERTGYKFVFLQKNKQRKLCFIQGLVAKTFLGDFSKKKQVNHIDGNKQNNNLSNLEWITASENIKHSFKLGMSNQKGSRNACSKLTENQVIEIRKRNKKGEQQNRLAEEYGVSKAVLNRIIKNMIWKHC